MEELGSTGRIYERDGCVDMLSVVLRINARIPDVVSTTARSIIPFYVCRYSERATEDVCAVISTTRHERVFRCEKKLRAHHSPCRKIGAHARGINPRLNNRRDFTDRR